MSRSLLSQLGLKSIDFIDSAEPIDPVKTGELQKGRPIFALSGMPGLFSMSFTRTGTKLIARKSIGMYARGAVDFDRWWRGDCIPGHNRARHSREWLVKQMANKEGGAHVDSEITKGYVKLKNTAMGFTVRSNGVKGFINSPANVSIRQIAWEVVESLKSVNYM